MSSRSSPFVLPERRDGNPELPPGSLAGAFRIVVVATVAGGLLYLAWRLSDVLLLGFAGIVLASVLHSLAEAVTRLTRLPIAVSVIAVAFGIAVATALAVYLFGTRIRAELLILLGTLPATLRALGSDFGVSDLDQRIAAPLTDFLSGGPVLSQLASYTGGAIAGATTALLVIMGSVYLR